MPGKTRKAGARRKHNFLCYFLQHCKHRNITGKFPHTVILAIICCAAHNFSSDKRRQENDSTVFKCLRCILSVPFLSLAQLSNLQLNTGRIVGLVHTDICDSAKHFEPLASWQGFCTNQLWTPIAFRLLQIPSSSASRERSSSLFGNILNKLRKKPNK